MAEVFDFGLQEHKIKMDGGFSNNGLFAVVGDTARRLEVQLLNSNNAIQDTTGINLRLNAEVAGKITFVDAVVKDSTKGIYTVNLSNGMFLEPGNWAFQWQVTKGTNKISSFPFAVKIGQNISEGGVQATNFYLNVEELRLKTVELENRYQTMINSTTGKDVISAPEIIAARKGEASLNARLTKNETETTAQFQQTNEKIPHRERIKLESSGEPHLESNTYTAFFTGANVKGREVHIGRTGNGHVGDGVAIYVAYIRQNDGTFSRKKIGGIDYTIGDYRDPNLSVLPEGQIILTAPVKLISGLYKNYYHVLNDEIDVIKTFEMLGMENYFSWGNTLLSSDKKVIKLGYMPSTTTGGVKLFENNGNILMTEIYDVFPKSAKKPTEATMGFWGGKLYAVTRQNDGDMLYRETHDLTGKSGWGDIISLGVKAHAPCTLTYTKEFDSLFLTASIEDETTKRTPFFVKVSSPKPIDKKDLFFIDTLSNRGGYNSLVTNQNGYGMMYYEDGITDHTSVFYKELNLNAINTNSELQKVVNDKRGFYTRGEWNPKIEKITNIDSVGNVRRAFFTIIGDFVFCSFELQDVVVTTTGKTEITFELPISRMNGNVTGNIQHLTSQRDSSGYVTFYQSTDNIKCFASLKVSDLSTGPKSIVVSAQYIIGK